MNVYRNVDCVGLAVDVDGYIFRSYILGGEGHREKSELFGAVSAWLPSTFYKSGNDFTCAFVYRELELANRGWGVVRGLEPWDNVNSINGKSSNKCVSVRLVQ